MRAQQLVAPFRFEQRDVAPPDERALAAGDVVVRTRAGGVCGSDIPFFQGGVSPDLSRSGVGWPPKPGFPMHEIAGTVVTSRHPGITEGTDIVGWACGCDALAELVVCRGDELAPYSAGLAPERAVALQPLACVLYAVERLGNLVGATATVMGLGPIGLTFGHVLNAHGAGRIVGVDRIDKHDIAAQFGIDATLETSTDRLASGDDRVESDIVVEAIGHQPGTLNDAVRLARPGGQVFYFGIPDDDSYVFHIDEFLRKGLTLRAGITRDRPRMLAEADAYAREHPDLLENLVTDTFPATEATAAFHRAMAPSDGHAKVTVRWT